MNLARKKAFEVKQKRTMLDAINVSVKDDKLSKIVSQTSLGRLRRHTPIRYTDLLKQLQTKG